MLTVYRASAGSGKTYQLTLEYLKLLFVSETAFRHILAVTFTNKATDEMKRRIVDELHVLAGTPGASGYTEILCRELGDTPESLQKKARKVLVDLLHDYSSFNISTIDRFFQQTTRMFTREIGLQGGYSLEMDQTMVLNQAIDRMLFELENPENKELLRWLLQFSEEKVESGSHWDIRSDIAALAGEIFKETYKQHSKEILDLTSDKKNLTRFLHDLYRHRVAFEELVREWGKHALELISEAGLALTDFKGGSRSPFLAFQTWAGGEVKEPTASFAALAGNVEAWFTKKTPEETIGRIRDVYENGLNDCVSGVMETFRSYPFYLSVIETGRYFYTLGILSDIDRHIRAYEQEHNILLLSDTTALLNRIIDGTDTPFVYEKIGSRIDHYMIDEFQDTSGMQWRNFYPLFKESLDKEKHSLIVGDVKQSIYRWRNSDWKLLSEEIKHCFGDTCRRDDVLDTNWRSAVNIVEFNNAFFSRAACVLQEKLNESYMQAGETADAGFASRLTDAYSDIYQFVPAKKKGVAGHVRLNFVDQDEAKDWTGYVLDQLPETLKQLQDKGYRLREIAFLVRNKQEGSLIADSLLTYKATHPDEPYRFDVISNEALYIGRSPAVKLMVSLLSYLHNPQEELNRILAAYEYEMARLGSTPEKALDRFFKERSGGRLFSCFAGDIATEIEQLKTLPLFEMCEKIVTLFPVADNGNESAFIQAFQDIVLEYTENHTADLASFLQWWEEKGCQKTISMPESQDALRILTIHKSKGLGFKVVIIPFCEWELDHSVRHQHILWCESHREPFNRIPLIPLRYSPKLEKTIYSEEYFQEKMQAYIDNLNLAYVAFTRAREELLLFAPKPKRENQVSTLSSLLHYCLTNEAETTCPEDADRPLIRLSENYDAEQRIYETGGSWQTLPESSIKIEECRMCGYRSILPGARMRLRLYGKGFFGDQQARQYGSVMHEILSYVNLPEDIPGAVNRCVLDGRLTSGEAKEIAAKLRRWITAADTSRWFCPEVRVLKETEILQQEGKFFRPDRIILTAAGVEIIDYKFGAVERPVYRRQVAHYMRLIRSMGYRQVTGYIWYVELGKTECVRE